MALDNIGLSAEIADRKLGMKAAVGSLSLLVVSGLIAGVWTGSPGMAAVFLGTAALGAVGAFIRGRNGR